MDILLALAVFGGIVWGLSRAIYGAEVRRLRNALSLATSRHADASAEVDLLRRTMTVYDAALARRDSLIRDLEASYREAAGSAQRAELADAPLPESVRAAIFGGAP